MSRQERVATQLVAKYGLTSARIRAGSRGHRHLCIKPALENRRVSESDVFKWTFWHCVSAALNQMVPARQGDRLYPIEWMGYFTEVAK